MTPKVLSEARLIDKERVQLLGQLTAELLVKAGCVGGWWSQMDAHTRSS